VVVEERARRVAELGREVRVGGEDELLGVLPVDGLVVLRDGGDAVVVGEDVEAEQLRLEAIPAARELVAVAHGGQQRLDGLVGGLVGEVARREPVRVGAQAVVGRLVGEQRVEDVGPRAQPGGERLGDLLGGRAARVAVGRHELGEGAVERDRLLLAGQVDGDRRGLLAEEPRPGRAAGDRLLGEDLLLGLGEQVRAVAARGAQEVARGVQAVGGEQLVRAIVLERRPLELEEDELRLDLRALLLDALQERAERRVGGVDAEAQHRVVAGPRRELGDLLQLGDGGGEGGGLEVAEAAGVAVGEGLRVLRGLVEETVGAGVVLAVDER
jgi:hypothetical protein